MIWHHETAESVIKEVEADLENGLSSQEASKRLKEFGANTYREKRTVSLFRQMRKQFKSLPMMFIFLAAVYLLCYGILKVYMDNSLSLLDQLIEPLLILLIPPIGCLIGAIWQKYGTAKLHHLTNTQTTTVKVLRDGKVVSIGAADVVRGDILYLETGMIVPADCRLITTDDLYCDEYIITGEDMDVAKNADAVYDGVIPITERTNMIYAGCGISHGSCTAVVVSVAQSTEYAILLNDPRNQTSPLPGISRDIASLERLVSLPVFILSFITLIVAIIRMGITEIPSTIAPVLTLTAVAIPSGLTVSAVVAMAMGMHHIVSRNADVCDLSVMDTLSRVTVICADKTGTLTKDEKRPVSVYTGEMELLSRMPSNRAQTLIQLATLCTANDTQKTGVDNTLISNPTESAIIEYARDIGIDRRKIMEETPRLAEIPFDTTRKIMSVVHLVAGRRLMISMGAPEAILALCTSGPTENVEEAISSMASQALRVLGVSYKYVDELSGADLQESDECDMTFAGLIAMADSEREDSAQAIKECANGGIITVMITGDNEETACAVARRLGIMQDDNQLLTGDVLHEMSNEELDSSVGMYRVFSRVAPEDKERIIRAWQKRDAVVAATGDCLEDVPALQRADIGCATGTADCDMTRNESDLTLYDNSFSTLVDTIKQARGIYANIRKVIQYTLTCSVALFVAVLITLIAQGTFIIPASTMVVYLLIGMLCSFAIAYESGDKHTLNEQPRHGIARLMTAGAWIDTLWQGLLSGICAFVAFITGLSGATSEDERLAFGLTTAFIALMFSRLWMMLATHRHDPDSPHFANRVMPVIFVLTAGITVAIVLIEPVAMLFGLVPVGIPNWILGMVFSVIPAVAAVIARFVIHILNTVRHVDNNVVSAS